MTSGPGVTWRLSRMVDQPNSSALEPEVLLWRRQRDHLRVVAEAESVSSTGQLEPASRSRLIEQFLGGDTTHPHKMAAAAARHKSVTCVAAR
jgi:hypothetical protein